MFIVDDPLLSLILRFVVDTDGAAADNEEFLKRQVQTLKQHVARFPDHEQGMRAMEWIEQHAKRYREDWQRRTVSRRTLSLRCSDCPLAGRGVAEHCEIHEQWLYLLRRYTAGELLSREYIERALGLLQEHKDRLKGLGSATERSEAAEEAAPKPKRKKKKRKDKAKKEGKGKGKRRGDSEDDGDRKGRKRRLAAA